MSRARGDGPARGFGFRPGWAGVLLLLLAGAGCGRSPSDAVPAAGPDARAVARDLQMRSLAPTRDAIRAALSPEKPIQVLALSGGGQWGAYGAGFVKGWTDHGRPESFQVVTGTSTGSLIATFAFLGRDYDDAVGHAYLGIRGDDDVLDKRFLLTALFSDALATTRPLRRLLEANVTDEMVRQVAAEGAKGRRLFVGAVDLDAGVFHPFDLTAIAASGPGARKDYIDALMASTAIPVAFPPAVIGGRAYVDGGVRRNSTLSVGSHPVRRRTIDIGKRAVDILLDESTDGNLLRVYLAAQRAQLAFRMTHVPADACSVGSSQENQFDPHLMRCLYDEGLKRGRQPESWTTEPPLGGFES
jgi:hypothetical protein